jgi:hypothetical protein
MPPRRRRDSLNKEAGEGSSSTAVGAPTGTKNGGKRPKRHAEPQGGISPAATTEMEIDEEEEEDDEEKDWDKQGEYLQAQFRLFGADMVLQAVRPSTHVLLRVLAHISSTPNEANHLYQRLQIRFGASKNGADQGTANMLSASVPLLIEHTTKTANDILVLVTTEAYPENAKNTKLVTWARLGLVRDSHAQQYNGKTIQACCVM